VGEGGRVGEGLTVVGKGERVKGRKEGRVKGRKTGKG